MGEHVKPEETKRLVEREEMNRLEEVNHDVNWEVNREVKFFPLGDEHHAPLAQLEVLLWGHHLHKDFERLEGFVAKCGEREVVGGLVFSLSHSIVNIHSLAILPTFQNQGIGTQLIQMTIDSLLPRKDDLFAVWLLVEETNQIAINLYKKFRCSVRPDRVCLNYYGLNRNALMMEHILQPEKYKEYLANQSIRGDSSLQSILQAGLQRACGVEVVSSRDRPLHSFPESQENELVAEKRRKLGERPHFWIRDAPFHPSIFSSTEALYQMEVNHALVTVEKSTRFPRAEEDLAYLKCGCSLVPSGAHQFSTSQPNIVYQPPLGNQADPDQINLDQLG